MTIRAEAELCVCYKGTYHRSLPEKLRKKAVTGSELDSLTETKKTTKGDALGLRFCFPSFKGDNMTETPRIGLLRAFQPYGLDSNHWNVFFFVFS